MAPKRKARDDADQLLLVEIMEQFYELNPRTGRLLPVIDWVLIAEKFNNSTHDTKRTASQSEMKMVWRDLRRRAEVMREVYGTEPWNDALLWRVEQVVQRVRKYPQDETEEDRTIDIGPRRSNRQVNKKKEANHEMYQVDDANKHDSTSNDPAKTCGPVLPAKRAKWKKVMKNNNTKTGPVLSNETAIVESATAPGADVDVLVGDETKSVETSKETIGEKKCTETNNAEGNTATTENSELKNQIAGAFQLIDLTLSDTAMEHIAEKEGGMAETAGMTKGTEPEPAAGTAKTIATAPGVAMSTETKGGQVAVTPKIYSRILKSTKSAAPRVQKAVKLANSGIAKVARTTRRVAVSPEMAANLRKSTQTATATYKLIIGTSGPNEAGGVVNSGTGSTETPVTMTHNQSTPATVVQVQKPAETTDSSGAKVVGDAATTVTPLKPVLNVHGHSVSGTAKDNATNVSKNTYVPLVANPKVPGASSIQSAPTLVRQPITLAPTLNAGQCSVPQATCASPWTVVPYSQKLHSPSANGSSNPGPEAVHLHELKLAQLRTAMDNELFAMKKLAQQSSSLRDLQLFEKKFEVEERILSAKVTTEERVTALEESLHAAKLRAIENSIIFSQELQEIERKTALLKQMEAEMNNRITELKLKKVEMELKQLESMSSL